ncbi:MAG TPA: hypothetical protein VFS00_04055 [Polyangiaceae bacterium]|nr:hypothetical protein [Polyangiaceae bacterium]
MQERAIAGNLERECSRTDVLCRRDDLAGARDRNDAAAGVAGGLAAVGAGVTTWLALSGGPKATASQALVLSPASVSLRGTFW